MWDVGGRQTFNLTLAALCVEHKKNQQECVITAQRTHLTNWLTPHPAATVPPIYSLTTPQPLHPCSPARCTTEKTILSTSLDISPIEKAHALAKQLPMLVPKE